MKTSLISAAIIQAVNFVPQKRTADARAKAKQRLDDVAKQLEEAKATIPAKTYTSAKFLLDEAYYFEANVIDQFNDLKELVDKFKGKAQRETAEFHEVYLKLEEFAKKTDIFKRDDRIKAEKTAFKPATALAKQLRETYAVMMDVIIEAEISSEDYHNKK